MITQLPCWKNKTQRNTNPVSVLPVLDKFWLHAHQLNFLVLSHPRQFQQLRCAEFTVLECVVQCCVLLNTSLENAWPQKCPFWWQQKRQQCFQKPFALIGDHSTAWRTPLRAYTLVHEHPPWQRTEDGHWAGTNTSTPPVSGLPGSFSPKATSSSPLVQEIFLGPLSADHSLYSSPRFHLKGIWRCKQTLDAVLC